MNSNLESVEAYGKLFGDMLEQVFPQPKSLLDELDAEFHSANQSRQAQDWNSLREHALEISRLARVLCLENQG